MGMGFYRVHNCLSVAGLFVEIAGCAATEESVWERCGQLGDGFSMRGVGKSLARRFNAG